MTSSYSDPKVIFISDLDNNPRLPKQQSQNHLHSNEMWYLPVLMKFYSVFNFRSRKSLNFNFMNENFSAVVFPPKIYVLQPHLDCFYLIETW